MKHTLGETVNAFSKEQFDHLLEGILDIVGWYEGHYSAEGGGSLLVAKVDVTTVATTMHWLTKYFYPDSIPRARRLYRVHDLRKPAAVSGKEVIIKPFKPLLSWTYRRKPDISDRYPEEHDVVLSADFATLKPIFSYKTPVALDLDASFERIKDKRRLRRLGIAVNKLRRTADGFAEEQEVMVWHGKKPFTAKIEEVL